MKVFSYVEHGSYEIDFSIIFVDSLEEAEEIAKGYPKNS